MGPPRFAPAQPGPNYEWATPPPQWGAPLHAAAQPQQPRGSLSSDGGGGVCDWPGAWAGLEAGGGGEEVPPAPFYGEAPVTQPQQPQPPQQPQQQHTRLGLCHHRRPHAISIVRACLRFLEGKVPRRPAATAPRRRGAARLPLVPVSVSEEKARAAAINATFDRLASALGLGSRRSGGATRKRNLDLR